MKLTWPDYLLAAAVLILAWFILSPSGLDAAWRIILQAHASPGAWLASLIPPS